MTRAEKHLLERAVQWWFQHRPVAYSHIEHMENPTVNTTTDAEQDLAKAVHRYFRSREMPPNGVDKQGGSNENR